MTECDIEEVTFSE